MGFARFQIHAPEAFQFLSTADQRSLRTAKKTIEYEIQDTISPDPLSHRAQRETLPDGRGSVSETRALVSGFEVAPNLPVTELSRDLEKLNSVVKRDLAEDLGRCEPLKNS